MSNEAVIGRRLSHGGGKFGGTLAGTPAADLGAVVIKDALLRAKVEAAMVDDVIMGQILTARVGQKPGQTSGDERRRSKETPAMTINHVCGSGLRAVHLAAQAVITGDADVVVAGGQEKYERQPSCAFRFAQRFSLGQRQIGG